ncbi:hypothetical protein GIY62_17325 [Burkholderia plantarii]|uniref:hypothetical protein n=1 Tax=Burkholderia plantarii TaxID=41899 RepID=UPI0027297F7D|nr:hypothetical protein [Burkholderia plantarii]WLE58847.1 hypothetical protein GIY62_17325 [Burkholderia plantarii]
MAGTVGNMVADRIKSQPSSVSSLYGVGGDVNSMVAEATTYKQTSRIQFSIPYSSDAALFGVTGPTSLDGITRAAAIDSVAASEAPLPYSSASVLYGLSGGMPISNAVANANGGANSLLTSNDTAQAILNWQPQAPVEGVQVAGDSRQILAEALRLGQKGLAWAEDAAPGGHFVNQAIAAGKAGQ